MNIAFTDINTTQFNWRIDKMTTAKSVCNDQMIREISRILIAQNPEAFFEITAEHGGAAADDKSCGETPDSVFTETGFEHFTKSYLVAHAVKTDCYIAYLKCVSDANKALDECQKKAGRDLDKLKACVDQHAASLKACIEAFEACKKKDG